MVMLFVCCTEPWLNFGVETTKRSNLPVSDGCQASLTWLRMLQEEYGSPGVGVILNRGIVVTIHAQQVVVMLVAAPFRTKQVCPWCVCQYLTESHRSETLK